MTRIKIKDLPKDMKISGSELGAIRGGKLRSPTGIIIESGSFQSNPMLPLGRLFAPVENLKRR